MKPATARTNSPDTVSLKLDVANVIEQVGISGLLEMAKAVCDEQMRAFRDEKAGTLSVIYKRWDVRRRMIYEAAKASEDVCFLVTGTH